MKHISIICLLPLFALFVGCDKENLQPKCGEGWVKEITNDEGETITHYSFGNNCEVYESWNADGAYSEGEKQEYTYAYDNSGKLIRKQGYEPGIIYMSSMAGAMGKDVDYSYEYDDKGRILKIRVDYDYDDQYVVDYSRETAFEYPNESTIIATITIINPLVNYTPCYTEYQLKSNGDIGKVVSYVIINSDKRISMESQFTYDNKNAPLYPEPGPVSKSNVLTRTDTAFNYDDAGNQSVAYTSTFTYEYTYTNNGYPAKQVETYPNGTKIIRNFKYE